MKIEEFLQLPILTIPTERADGVDYYHHVLHALIAYEDALLKVDNFEIGGSDYWFDQTMKEHVIAFSRQLKIAIVKALQAKQDENPAGAYEALQQGLEDQSLVKIVMSQKLLRTETNWYRLRKITQSRKFELKEIFHPPLSERENIPTQKFSTPGYPCLYMANSTYVCWLELGVGVNQDYFGSCFRHVSSKMGELRLLDLRNSLGSLRKNARNPNALWDGELFRFLSLWPLIFTASVKVKYRDKPYKPEYDIPQILMQCIKRGTAGLHGVKYSSPHVSIELNDELYNVAIPIHATSRDPYCGVRTEQFKFTKPVTIQVSKWEVDDNDESFLRIQEKFKEVDIKIASKPFYQINPKGDVL